MPWGTGPHVLQPTAEACQRPENWGIFAAAVWSFCSLCGVTEIAPIRRSGLSSKVVAFWGIKTDLRSVSRDIGEFLGE